MPEYRTEYIETKTPSFVKITGSSCTINAKNGSTLDCQSGSVMSNYNEYREGDGTIAALFKGTGGTPSKDRLSLGFDERTTFVLTNLNWAKVESTTDEYVAMKRTV